MVKKFHRFRYYIIILFIAVLIRSVYFINDPVINVQPDTYGYYFIGQQILYENFQKNIFNSARTPVYPVFLNAVTFLTGFAKAPVFSPGFMKAMGFVIFIQTLVGLTSLILYYKLLIKLKTNTFPALLLTLFIATDIMVFGWERILMTESLCVFYLVATSLLAWKIFRKPKNTYFILLFILSCFAVMLKPVYVFLPPLTIIIIAFHFRKFGQVLKCVVTLFGFILLIYLYSSHNAKYFNYNGINQVVEINYFGKVLTQNLPVEAGKSIKYIYDSVVDWRGINGEKIPFRLFEHYSNILFSHPNLYNDMRIFDSKIFLANLPEYLYKTALEIPGGLMEGSEHIILPDPNRNLAGYFFNSLYNIDISLPIIGITVFIALPFTIYYFLKINTPFWAAMAVLEGFCVYQIGFSVASGYGEFGRLIAPGLPLIYFITFFWWKKAITEGVKLFNLLNLRRTV